MQSCWLARMATDPGLTAILDSQNTKKWRYTTYDLGYDFLCHLAVHQYDTFRGSDPLPFGGQAVYGNQLIHTASRKQKTVLGQYCLPLWGGTGPNWSPNCPGNSKICCIMEFSTSQIVFVGNHRLGAGFMGVGGAVDPDIPPDNRSKNHGDYNLDGLGGTDYGTGIGDDGSFNGLRSE